ncbi:hypothetical protein MTR67_001741 [Solanum verrucosum]|uniref:Uncharacterized protein n=1 Tax=Solanum verrucosum TaxID=315347 RepID=A0AAF0PPR8_SOLVR|nr:hypothetical protein MTR67_001741 [Solanum verrucosum]
MEKSSAHQGQTLDSPESSEVLCRWFTDRERNYGPSTYSWFTLSLEMVDHGTLHWSWTTTQVVLMLVVARQNLSLRDVRARSRGLDDWTWEGPWT